MEPELTEEQVAAIGVELHNQIATILNDHPPVVIGTALFSLLLTFVKENFGEDAADRVLKVLAGITHEAELKGQAPTARYMNALVDRDYDWPAAIGKARKAGR